MFIGNYIKIEYKNINDAIIKSFKLNQSISKLPIIKQIKCVIIIKKFALKCLYIKKTNPKYGCAACDSN